MTSIRATRYAIPMISLNQIILLPCVALAASVLLHTHSLKLFPKWGLLDFPKRYGLKRRSIPYPTGIISVMLFLVLFGVIQPLLAEPWSRQHTGLIVSIAILAFASFVDDRRQLSSKVRLQVQIICALIIFGTGTRIFSLTNPLEAFLGFERIQLDTFVIPSPQLSDPSVIGAIFTVLWLGLTINALNWFDGIPGQVNVLAVIGFLTIGFLSYSARVAQPELALLSFILAGIAAGGLLFDFPPAKVLMGDSGAMFYGLMLGVLTIYAGGKVATAFLVLGVPIIDFVIVIGRRISKRKPIMRGGGKDEHLHHRLLSKGWPEPQVILLTAVLGSVFGISALFLTTTEKFVSAIILFAVMLGLSRYSRVK